MHPIARKRHAVGTLALGNLVFVVREDQVLPAAMAVSYTHLDVYKRQGLIRDEPGRKMSKSLGNGIRCL